MGPKLSNDTLIGSQVNLGRLNPFACPVLRIDADNLQG